MPTKNKSKVNNKKTHPIHKKVFSIVNVGDLDRTIRVILGLFIFMSSIVSLSDFFRVLGIIFGIALISTGILGYCGFYQLLGISTCPKKTTK